jgi:hypothetical protein
MKMEPRSVERQAERTFVADEMYFMTALGEFFTQRGGKTGAAPVGRLARDSDVDLLDGWHIRNCGCSFR